MAISVALFGPTNRLPHLARGEFQTLRLVGDGTQVVVAAGGGTLHAVHVGVAGTLAVATVATAALGRQFEGDVAFSQGLTVITTGASSDITIEFWGMATRANSRTFGV
jgi:hypothetical protein